MLSTRRTRSTLPCLNPSSTHPLLHVLLLLWLPLMFASALSLLSLQPACAPRLPQLPLLPQLLFPGRAHPACQCRTAVNVPAPSSCTQGVSLLASCGWLHMNLPSRPAGPAQEVLAPCLLKAKGARHIEAPLGAAFVVGPAGCALGSGDAPPPGFSALSTPAVAVFFVMRLRLGRSSLTGYMARLQQSGPKVMSASSAALVLKSLLEATADMQRLRVVHG